MKRRFSLSSSRNLVRGKLLLGLTGLLALTAVSPDLVAQQSNVVAAKPFVEEWVYRVQYGHKDEWWQIFRKYQIAILERQKQLGYVKDYTVWAPGLHTDESSRWDYRVIIVRAAADAPAGQSEDEIAKQLFPDQATFKREENRRWELTANHWDLPIHQVKPEPGD
ncbi:MAG TPA: hypothetical protein VGG85_10355 [Terracidiphilus sp.]|jgi:hypothetical protein